MLPPSWSGVIPSLVAAGHRVIAAANPLRSVSTDAASVASVIDAVGGPVLVVAHSYGGTVMSAAAAGKEPLSDWSTSPASPPRSARALPS